MCSKDTKRIVVNLDVQTKNLLGLPWRLVLFDTMCCGVSGNITNRRDECERSRTTAVRYSGKMKCQSPQNECSCTVEQYKEATRNKSVLTTALSVAHSMGKLICAVVVLSRGWWSEPRRREPQARNPRLQIIFMTEYKSRLA